MSVEALAVALHHTKTTNPTTKWVLAGIANHDGDGGSWPSIATLAKYALCSERTVQRAINELVALGEVKVEVQAGGPRDLRNDHRPNLYRFLLKCPTNCDRSSAHRVHDTPASTSPASAPDGVTRVTPRGADGVTPPSPREVHGVTPVTPRGDTGDADGVTQVSPEPSLEPSLKGEAGARGPERPAKIPTPKDTRTRLDRCSKHQHDIDAPPCGACADAVRGAAAAEQARAREAGAARSAEARRAAQLRRRDIDRCQLCDEAGYRGTRLCDHDPEGPERAAARAAQVRAALNRRTQTAAPAEATGRPVGDAA